MPPYDSYFICTSPRSGSTLLCKLLEDCGAGHPQSYFHRPNLQDWRTGLELAANATTGEIIATAQARGRGDTPICGVRLQQGSFAFFRAELARLHPGHPSDLTRIQASFGRTAFLHLSRADKLAQAVSLLRAQQSGLWHRNADGSELERIGPGQTLAYDPTAIAAERAAFLQMDRDWTNWFAAQGISPITVGYTELVQDPQATLERLLTTLGLPTTPARTIAPRTAKLADQISADWIERFRAQTPQTDTAEG